MNNLKNITMNDLSKAAMRLKDKQTHVRKYFLLFLEHWEKATDEFLQDNKLEIIPIGGFKEESFECTNQLFLERGRAELLYLSSYDFMCYPYGGLFEMWEEGLHQDLDIMNCDMQYIRVALEYIPEGIAQHLNDLKRAKVEATKLIKLFEKINI